MQVVPAINPSHLLQVQENLHRFLWTNYGLGYDFVSIYFFNYVDKSTGSDSSADLATDIDAATFSTGVITVENPGQLGVLSSLLL